MAAFGVFGLAQLIAFSQYIRSKLSAEYYQVLFRTLVVASGAISLAAILVLTAIGSEF